MDVALITCSEWPQLSPSDATLLNALLARDIDARPLVWNDPAVDWSRPRVSVIRSTWDYYNQHEAFLEWAQHVSQLHTLWNPLPLLQWNTHKSYLRNLEEHDVPIIPTAWFAQGSQVNFAQLMQQRGWSEAVIKPAVSVNAYGTILVKEDMELEGQLYLDHMVSLQDMLVQPFLPTVLSSGERSLIVIDGEVTHAILRPPINAVRPDDKQTQPDLPKKALVVPQEDELQLARKIMDVIAEPLLYGRFDLVRDMNGLPRVMEIELVEPGLWLDWAPAAVERFADAIAREVQQQGNGNRIVA